MFKNWFLVQVASLPFEINEPKLTWQKKTDRQTDRQTSRQAGRQAGRQTEREKEDQTET